jgi:hypothetical protein
VPQTVPNLGRMQSIPMVAGAFRSDIQSYLAPAWKDTLIGHPTSLLQVIRRVRLLLDFCRLTDVVVRQVVPFQIVFRRPERAVFFSPARLDQIGLP